MLPSVDLGGHAVPTFMLCLTASALSSILVVISLSRLEGIGTSRPLIVMLFFLAGALLGGKTLSVISTPANIFMDPDRHGSLDVWLRGGFSFYGGLIGGILASLIPAAVARVSIPGFLDIAGTSSYLGLAVGRIGCLLKGCCYGKPTLFPVALEYHDFESAARPIGVPLHATQLYEMMAALIVFSVLVLAGKKTRIAGLRLALALLLYPIPRLFLETLRGEELLVIKGLSFHQWVSLSLAVVGLILLSGLIVRRHGRHGITPGIGMMLLPLLFLSPAGCNRHKTMPAALCRTSGDCMNGERCVEGRCVFRDILDMEIRFVKIYNYPMQGDLLVEAVRMDEGGPGEVGRQSVLIKRIESPRFPVSVLFQKVPTGKYHVTACIDIDANGACAAPDPGDTEIVRSSLLPKGNVPKDRPILLIKYKLME
jgi:phosphatidylglycerol:prolipoprotein diacylglycerol transferase